MDRLRVVLLDDEVLIRKLVRMKLNTEALHLEIVGEFSSAGMAVEKLEELKYGYYHKRYLYAGRGRDQF